MTTRVITGTKQQIADEFAKIEGEIVQAIVFIDEPVTASTEPVPATVEEMFKEMEPYMSNAKDVDDSREAIYTRKSGE